MRHVVERPNRKASKFVLFNMRIARPKCIVVDMRKKLLK